MSTGQFCTGCGRELVDVAETTKRHDRDTGERNVEVWRQCPKFARNGFVYVFQNRSHDSFLRDSPLLGRTYR
jgi:hypothetical protein